MTTYEKLMRLLNIETGFIYVIASSIINSSLGAGFFLYFATLVSVDGYGQINYLISSGAIAFAITALGMDATIMTFVPKKSINVLYQANFLVFLMAVSAAIFVGILLNNFLISLLNLATASYYMSGVELLTKKKVQREFYTINWRQNYPDCFISFTLLCDRYKWIYSRIYYSIFLIWV